MFTKADIEKYFIAEKNGGLFILVLGIAAVTAAVVFFFFIKTNFCKGAAVPLLVFGLLLGVVGFTVYNRSDKDRIKNVYAYNANPSELKLKELPRMQTVLKNFIIYRWVEIVLVLIGATLFFYYRADAARAFWKGCGLALAIMSGLGLIFDFVADIRAKKYYKGMTEFVEQGSH